MNDVLVALDKTKSIKGDIVIGTSSTRRVAFLKHFYPKTQIVDMRGNLQTRFQKLQDGHCDALMLAYAGLHRMEMDEYISEKLPFTHFIPAVGQGTVAIEAATSLRKEKKDAIRAACNDLHTESCLRAERAYLKYLNGGCSIPVFANCTRENETLTISGGIVSLDGQKFLKKTLTAPSQDAELLGTSLAKEIMAMGGDKVLEDIRKTL